ncbi:Oligopeptide transporter, OPT superfamily [Phaffia rhodozyma]|uniref:OPT oligopeptide transporter n=1 Tax=Phaffia rhodozyma TaxID=264483 RepID=A0A0F7STB7_PHARH|nr:OPT oligopeptide transporter [Phaffia rhodozyma]CED85432.1 Oligopeptide transporter, OPT superfamily [Phaffia rhodozyma]
MSEIVSLPKLGTGFQQSNIDRNDPSVPEIHKHEAHHLATSDSNEYVEKKEDYSEDKVHPVDNDVFSLKEGQNIVLLNDGNPFPVDPNAPVEGQTLTFRAVFVGTVLGFIVGASNVYLGLKTGFTFGATLFGSIVGFAILKPLSIALPTRLGGGYFGPKENVTVQSAAGSAGGLSGLFVAAVPALYQLGLLTTPEKDIGSLIALSFITAFYGLFFAMPLRKYYILKQKLTFPSPTATAFTIRNLHSASTPAARKASSKKIKILGFSFLFSLIWTVLTKYAPGILWGWDFGWLFSQWGAPGAIALSNWGWSYQFTPAFHAVGFLTGPNAAFSWMFGAILSYAIIGPSLVATGQAYSPVIDESIGYHSNFAMSTVNLANGTTDPHRGTARYWLLWPGVLVMLIASFTELFLQAPMFYRIFRQLINNTRKTVGEKRGKDMSHITDIVPEGSEDPAPQSEQVATRTWMIGMVISVVTTMVVGKTEFGLNPGVSFLALILGFVFAFVGVNASGTTDTNPIGVIAKAGQLIIGGVTKGQGISVASAQRTSLIAGSVVGQSAAHSVDCVGDLKTGHLIGASPRAQFWAQLAGSTAGFAFAPALFLVFAKAYPCINDPTIDTCPFSLPAVSAWKAVAIAVSSPTLPVTLSSGMTAIGLAVVAALCHIGRFYAPPRYAIWIPNWNAVGLAFVVPQVYYAIAMSVGCIIAMIWERRRPATWEIWGFALAAGMIAGEGIGGVITALLVILNIDGSKYGTAVGCILNEYCG